MVNYKRKVTVLFYSEKETNQEAYDQIKEMCKIMGDRFEKIIKVEKV